MAITRRQFVGTLGALAAAAGISQAELTRITDAFAHGGAWSTGGWTNKPKVIWVHGAECTGCSTSVLGLFEDAVGTAVDYGSFSGASKINTAAALNLAVGGSAADSLGGSATYATLLSTVQAGGPIAGHPMAHRTLFNAHGVTGTDPDGQKNSAYAVNIADVLIDVLSLQYHETVMSMGGDLAYHSLREDMATWNNGTGTWSGGSAAPFVLVVEGAVQDDTKTGYWKKARGVGGPSWCSIGLDGQTVTPGPENTFADVVEGLAVQDNCVAVVAVGQCATYGGYPACIGPGLFAGAGSYDPKSSQTGAKGVYDFLLARGNVQGTGGAGSGTKVNAAANKVINVPGCPVNPWWFVLSVVAWLVDATSITSVAGGPAGFQGATILGVLKGGADGLAINGNAVDNDRRLNMVFDYPLHSGRCPRYNAYSQGYYAARPGDPGCLYLLGCKGPNTKSLCAVHGWNNAQPENSAARMPSFSKQSVLDNSPSGKSAGGYCISAGAPCMGCSEKGYPDAFSPFVVNR